MALFWQIVSSVLLVAFEALLAFKLYLTTRTFNKRIAKLEAAEPALV